MTIHHLAIWTFRLEELKTFYTTYFKGKSNEKYINPQRDSSLILFLLTEVLLWS